MSAVTKPDRRLTRPWGRRHPAVGGTAGAQGVGAVGSRNVRGPGTSLLQPHQRRHRIGQTGPAVTGPPVRRVDGGLGRGVGRAHVSTGDREPGAPSGSLARANPIAGKPRVTALFGCAPYPLSVRPARPDFRYARVGRVSVHRAGAVQRATASCPHRRRAGSALRHSQLGRSVVVRVSSLSPAGGETSGPRSRRRPWR